MSDTWIPVTERLPDDDATVLIFLPKDPEPVWLGYSDEDGWYSVEAVLCEPTHWRELPEPPSKETP